MAICFGWLGGAQAESITDWNTLLLDTIRTESTSPPVASRGMAMVHGAMFDAVNAIDG